MRVNKTKARLAAGETVVGCFVSYAEPTLAEFVALQGWDFLVFDGEHGPLEPGLPIYRNHSVYPARSTTPTSRPQ